jgi:PAS domain S-box-containing protein
MPLTLEIEDLPLATLLVENGQVRAFNQACAAFVSLLQDSTVRWYTSQGLVQNLESLLDTSQTSHVSLVALAGEVQHFFDLTGRALSPERSLWQVTQDDADAVLRRRVFQAVESLPDAITLTTKNLEQPGPHFLYANPQFTSLSGYTREELIHLTPRILQGPKTDTSELLRLKKNLKDGTPFHGGAVNYRKSGEAFWNEWHIAQVPRVDGTLDCYAAVMSDTGALRVGAQVIPSLADEWGAVLDVLDAMVVLTDTDGVIVQCNQAFEKSSRLPRRYIVESQLKSILFGSNAPLEDPQQLYRTDPVLIQLPNFPGWYQLRSIPISHALRIEYWVHVFENATRAHNLEEHTRLLLLATNQSSDGLALISPQFRIQYVNGTFLKIVGHDLKTLNDDKFTAPQLNILSNGRASRAFQQALAVGQFTERTAATRADGSPFFASISITRVNDGDTLTGYTLVVSDITETERLRRMTEISSLMDNMGHWLIGLRHELGNPVNSVKMALTVLQNHYRELSHEQIGEYVDRAAFELGRVEFLLGALRNFSQFETISQERISLESFLNQLLSLVRPDLNQRNIQIEAPVSSQDFVRADPRALHQVLINLITNAADSIASEGGHIRIETIGTTQTPAIRVVDNGRGMSAEQLNKAFRPFETTKTKGTGLGLVIVRKLMASMGGTVEIQSALGQGTTVTLFFESGPSAL